MYLMVMDTPVGEYLILAGMFLIIFIFICKTAENEWLCRFCLYFLYNYFLQNLLTIENASDILCYEDVSTPWS